VKARRQYSTLNARLLLIAVLACALSGCWEEIHYSPPPTGSTPAARTPPPAAEIQQQAESFADDVA
jgi:hypothetical protein